MSQAGDLDLMLSVSGSKIDVAGGKAAGVSKGKERAPKTIRQVNALMNNSGSRNVVASKKKSSRTGKPNQEVLVEVKAKTVREEALAQLQSKTGSGNGLVSIKFNHYNKKIPIFNGVLTWKDVDDEYAFSFVYKGKYSRKMIDITTGILVVADEDGDYFVNLVDGQGLIVEVEEGQEGIGAEGIRLKAGPLLLSNNDPDDTLMHANKQVDNLTRELLNMDVSNLQSDEAKRIREERDVEDILFSGT